jgi:uncharacterized paraquat-inducible protein A
MAGQIRCPSCGHPLSRHAASCPRCGAPQPHKRLGSTVGLAILLALLAAGVIWTLLGGA